MREEVFAILKNEEIACNTWRLVLKGKGLEGIRAGQFVNIRVEPLFLHRPISVCDVDEDRLTLIYKKVGKGTDLLSGMKTGDLDLLIGLGNGYDPGLSGERPLLLGGGAGVPPLYYLAKKLREEKKEVKVVLGFNRSEEIFMKEDFEKLGCEVFVTTLDGSCGRKGFVSDVMKDLDYTYFYTCGPLPMLKAVYRMSESEGQFSLEERMGCGFGACMGCTIEVKGGHKRVCKEGPVFEKKELLWED